MIKILLAISSVGAVLVLAAASPPQAQSQQVNLIHVEIDGLRNDKGQVLCALFSSAADFPKNGDTAIEHAKSGISHGQAVCEFPGVAPGRYAVSVFHDENSNGKMDTNLVGIPREVVGAIEQRKGSFRAAEIRSCGFSLFRRPGGPEDHDLLFIGSAR
jgi:uncharacterized protein (DUF2141 family)